MFILENNKISHNLENFDIRKEVKERAVWM